MYKVYEAIATLIIFFFGASIGSFLNVVVYRLPAGISLIYPPSRCPKCLHRLGKTENVPVLGWLWLQGRCRWCATPISPRYPLVEAITGLLFVLVFGQFGITGTSVGYCIFLSWLLALALIDLDTMTLPNVLTESGLLVGLGYQMFEGWFSAGSAGWASYLMWGIGSAVLGIWLFDTITIVGTIALGQPAMGGGDAKLAAMIGAWLGWKNLLLTGFLACGVGAVVGTAAIALGLLSRKQPLPFGPFLVLGAVLSVFWGEAFLRLYLDLFFPLGVAELLS
ncbi:MAG: prepilin peptidase [Gomphosphaeria aponina SAG 52.96 = DSM 107014]|uniref:Prepilin leader peptidase/N-methyltransferase n=1 Tax=Gomphosphaeria aponina SAG 52.96 = DSM 107014 TaxID=1521640 RepID=A0A941JTP8_9CHRO|nr:prepilin peptidase [Gomphosphaeria aponina SAG 52.96 = DSM 107014]